MVPFFHEEAGTFIWKKKGFYYERLFGGGSQGKYGGETQHKTHGDSPAVNSREEDKYGSSGNNSRGLWVRSTGGNRKR